MSRRLVLWITAAGLLLTTACASAAQMPEPSPSPLASEEVLISESEPSAEIHFADVSEADPAWPAIEFMAHQGVLLGTGRTPALGSQSRSFRLINR